MHVVSRGQGCCSAPYNQDLSCLQMSVMPLLRNRLLATPDYWKATDLYFALAMVWLALHFSGRIPACACRHSKHHEEIFAKPNGVLWQSLPSLLPWTKTLLDQTLASSSEPTSQLSLDLGPILARSAWSSLSKNPAKSV